MNVMDCMKTREDVPLATLFGLSWRKICEDIFKNVSLNLSSFLIVRFLLFMWECDLHLHVKFCIFFNCTHFYFQRNERKIQNTSQDDVQSTEHQFFSYILELSL